MPMAATKVWTLQELDSLPDDENTYELVHGELFVTPAPGPRHEDIAARLTAILLPYVLEHRLGLIYHPRGVVQHAGSQVEPDLNVRQSLKAVEQWDRAPVPILVVEILSPSNRSRLMAAKRSFYSEVDVAEYWIVDPENRTVTSVRPGRPDTEFRDTLTWHPRGPAAPLLIDLADVFVSRRGITTV